jgi:hypothetical protein
MEPRLSLSVTVIACIFPYLYIVYSGRNSVFVIFPAGLAALAPPALRASVCNRISNLVCVTLGAFGIAVFWPQLLGIAVLEMVVFVHIRI